MIILPSAIGFVQGPLGPFPPLAIFPGAGLLKVNARDLLASLAQFGGASTFGATATYALGQRTGFNATAALSAALNSGMALNSIFGGIGAIPATLAQVMLANGRFSGASSIGVDFNFVHPFQITFIGAGSFGGDIALFRSGVIYLLPAASLSGYANIVTQAKAAAVVGTGSLGVDTYRVVSDSMRATATLAAAFSAMLNDNMSAGSVAAGAGILSLPTIAEQQSGIGLATGSGGISANSGIFAFLPTQALSGLTTLAAALYEQLASQGLLTGTSGLLVNELLSTPGQSSLTIAATLSTQLFNELMVASCSAAGASTFRSDSAVIYYLTTLGLSAGSSFDVAPTLVATLLGANAALGGSGFFGADSTMIGVRLVFAAAATFAAATQQRMTAPTALAPAAAFAISERQRLRAQAPLIGSGLIAPAETMSLTSGGWPLLPNYAANSRMLGVVPITAMLAATTPPGYSYQSAGGTGITDVVGSGVFNGIEYIDLRFHGSHNSSTGSTFAFVPVLVSSVQSDPGDQWTTSIYATVLAGGFNVNTTGVLQNIYYDGGGINLGTNSNQPAIGSGDLDTQRYSVSGAAPAGTVFMAGGFIVTSPTVAYDVTLRIGRPQIESGLVMNAALQTPTAMLAASGAIAFPAKPLPLSVTGQLLNTKANQLVGANPIGLSVSSSVAAAIYNPATTILGGIIGGTRIGNFTGGSRDWAPFDGNISTNTAANSGQAGTTTSAYCGLSLQTPKRIWQVIIDSSSDAGFVTAANPSVTLSFYAKTGAAPANATDGTLLGSTTITDTTGLLEYTIASSDIDTLFAHVWVTVSIAAAAALRLGQLRFYETLQQGNSSYAVLDPAFKTTNLFDFGYDDGYLSVQATDRNSSGGAYLAGSPKSSGKFYCEVAILYYGTGGGIGIATTATNLSAYLTDANSWMYMGVTGHKYHGGDSAYGSAYGAGAIIGCALDLNIGAVWFSLNGVWQHSATAAEIAAGTTTNAAFSTGIAGNTIRMAQGILDNIVGINKFSTWHFDPATWTYTAPSGFGPWIAVAN